MAKIETYKDLKVWQQGIEIAKSTYLLCSNLPENEKFGLISQMKRSSISISSNIAEGWGRGTNKNFSHFLKIARGSLSELETQITLSIALNFITEKESETLLQLLVEESKMLNSLIKKLNIEENETSRF